MSHLYLGAVAFGVTLLVASFLLGGKDVHAGGGGHHFDSAPGLGWAPIGSLRFWVFLFTFGGGAGYALTALDSSELVAGVGALGVGWVSGTLAVAIMRRLTKNSVSSGIEGADLIGTTGTLLLPVGTNKPGKVRVAVTGRTEDFVAVLGDGDQDLPSGTEVMIIAEGDQGSLLVGKHEV